MTAYPTARLVANRIRERLARNGSIAHPGPNDPAASVPGADAIEAIVDAGFWASLRREEGRTPQLSLAFVSPAQVRHPLLFERAVALAPEPLTRVAPAVERPGLHLGVWGEPGEWKVWGAVRALPRHCFVLEVIAPGSLIIKQSPAEDSGKFINIAVLLGDEVKIVDQAAAHLPELPEPMVQLAVSMRAHGRGGTLLVVPEDSEPWRESIVHPILYSVTPAFSAMSDLLARDAQVHNERWWQDALRRAVDGIAGLTAVDGATVMSRRYELLAFGAKIVRRLRHAQVSSVVVTEPIEESIAGILNPTELGGTRHLSAAQFVHDQRDALALVASQDGRFTVFAWSPAEEQVHAHRIETLLL